METADWIVMWTVTLKVSINYCFSENNVQMFPAHSETEHFKTHISGENPINATVVIQPCVFLAERHEIASGF